MGLVQVIGSEALLLEPRSVTVSHSSKVSVPSQPMAMDL